MPFGDDIIIGNPPARYSDYTQNITNEFPDWHVARRQRDSNIAKLVSSVAANEMEHILNRELPNFLTQKFVLLANPRPNESAYILDTSKYNKPQSDTMYNMLVNSNFVNWSNPSRPPDFWELETEDMDLLPYFNLISMFKDTNYVGGKTLRVRNLVPDATTFGRANIYQDVNIPIDNEQTEWTASVWTKRLGNTVVTSNFYKLYVQVFYIDQPAPPELVEYIVDSTDYQRFTIKFTTDKKISKIRVGFSYTPLVNSVDLRLLCVTNFFLHPTHTDNFWARHPEDRPYFIEQEQVGKTVLLTKKDSNFRYPFTEITDNDASGQLLPNKAFIEFFPLEEVTIPIITPIRIQDGFLIDGRRIPQGLVIGNVETAAKYGWGTWCYGKLVKFNILHPDEIHGVYLPSFPIINDAVNNNLNLGKVENVSSLELQAVTERDGYLWILLKKKQGSSMRFTNFINLMLIVVESNLPKVPNSEDVNDATIPIFLPIVYTYYFNTAEIGGAYGVENYGTEEFGGNTPPDTIRHTSMAFINNKQIKTTMETGYESVITLHKNYFIEDERNSQIILFRDPREDDNESEVVVW